MASDSTTTFHATATDASGNVSPCSSTSVSYVEDSTAPSATIGSGPSGTTEDTTPTFEFSTNDAGAALTCRVDSAAFAPCASPLTTAALAEGQHAFDVRATDAAGNVGSDSRSFVVKITTTPPPPPPPRVPPHPGCSATGNVILGTSGNDTRAGTPAKDLMFGLRGNDALEGRGGSDCLYGNEGADRLSGGTGNDVIRGGGGSDHLTGNAGDDEVVDTSGRDELSGGSGNDRLNARDASRSGRRVADVVRCGPGRRDVALVDRRDRVSRDCERVRRR